MQCQKHEWKYSIKLCYLTWFVMPFLIVWSIFWDLIQIGRLNSFDELFAINYSFHISFVIFSCFNLKTLTLWFYWERHIFAVFSSEFTINWQYSTFTNLRYGQLLVKRKKSFIYLSKIISFSAHYNVLKNISNLFMNIYPP